MADIIKNVGKIHIAVVADKETRDGELAKALSNLAIQAIMGGLGSPPWRKYMSIFADNPEQLTLLSAAGEPEDDYLPETRAYIVSNAVCAAGTNTATTNGIKDATKTKIASAVDNATDPTMEKPAEITTLLAGL